MSEFKGGESVATKKRKEKQGEIERLHEKTFKAWLNSQLRVRGIRLERDLHTELSDGLVLINTVEILSGEKCPEKYNPKPTLEIHKIENITIAINFIQKFVKISISANDVAQGNMRLILGMIWRLILTFKVEGKDEDNEKLSAAQRNRAAKKKLLDWCIEKTKGHKGVNIEDFGASWYDGLGFCALIHAFDPSLIDFDSLSPDNAAHNLDLAFDLAEKHLDIPRLLDPADICAADPGSRPDEQCFMTYLSEFPIAFLAHKEQADSRDAKKREEEARRRAEEEERLRRLAEEEARRKAELEAQAEAMRRREEEAKRKAEEDEKERKRKEEKLKRKAEEALRAAEEKAKLDADEAARRAREEAERKAAKKAAKAKKKAEEEERKRQAEADAREGEHEAERLRLEEECRRLRAELDATKGRLIGKLKVNVVEARGLKKADAFSKSDPYCVLFLERQKEKTRTIKKSLEPKWEADFEFYHSDPDASLEVTVFDWNRIFSDDFLGKVTIPISDLRDGQETSTWYKLEGKKAKDKVSGEIHLKLLYRKEK